MGSDSDCEVVVPPSTPALSPRGYPSNLAFLSSHTKPSLPDLNLNNRLPQFGMGELLC